MNYKLGLTKRVIWGTMRPFIKAWMRILMDPTVINGLPRELKPPYLIISNHTNVYDGLIVALYSPELPVPVFDDIQKQNAFLRLLFTYTGVAFKSYGVPDIKSIRSMVNAKDDGRIILLYPEGEITWTGENKPLESNVPRLIKLLKIPVVLVKAKGAYTKQPKWAVFFRKGRCIFDFRLFMSEEEVIRNDEGFILEKLQQEFRHNDMEWLKTPEAVSCGFSSNQPAKGLERWLFCCPSCNGTNCMNTEDSSGISCSYCGYSVGIDAYLNVVQRDAEPVFRDLAEWGRWQKGFWVKKVTEAAASSTEDETILEACCTSAKKVSLQGKGRVSLKQGKVHLKKSSIEVVIRQKTELKLDYSDILVCHCYKFIPGHADSLVVRTREEYYIFDLSEPYSPSLSWEFAINALRQQRK